MGPYQAGRLWISSEEMEGGQDRRGEVPNEEWTVGKWKETRGKWVRFDGKQRHGVERCVGKRYSIV